MSHKDLDAAIAAANPVDHSTLASFDAGVAEAALFERIASEPLAEAVGGPGGRRPRSRGRGARRALLALVFAATFGAVALGVFGVLSGSSKDPASAYGAELVRFAEASPLLLLDEPGWRVQNVNQYENREGSMEFVTGEPIPYESIFIHEDGTESGMFRASVRQRRVELDWRRGSLAEAVAGARGMPHPHGQDWIKAPVLGTTAEVDTRAEGFRNHGGPGDRIMRALWAKGDRVLELRAAVPDLAAFEERLRWLREVDSETWLDAMPASVVKAADHDVAVDEMLEGIPLPPGFDPARIVDKGLTTSRYQVGVTVAGGVACAWFRHWGEARRRGDATTAKEAERVLAGAGGWPIFREMSRDGGYPALVVEFAEAMPSGRWYGRPLLPDVGQGLGCAAIGFPLREGAP